MSAPSEPEKYSFDEMMDRLKKKRPDGEEPENGELVTRSDGSRAVRVRKRKRRSQQPQKEDRRKTLRARMIQVSAALILILLALFAAGVAIVYANSAPFREGLAEKITRSSGAKVELNQFRMNPTSANAASIVLTWPAGNVLRELAARSIRAEIFPSSFLGKSMVGEELSAATATLNLQIPDPAAPVVYETLAEDAPPIRFKLYAIPDLNVLLGDPGAPLIRLMNSEATFSKSDIQNRNQLLLNRGKITIGGWRLNLRMDRSHVEFRGNEVDVVGVRLKHETDPRGNFELAGTISPYDADRTSSLAVELDSFLISGLVGEELGKIFPGRIDTVSSSGESVLSFNAGPNLNPSLTVDFRSALSSNLEISGFPFLVSLSQILVDDWFEHPVFDNEARGKILRAGGNVVLSDLDFETKGRMALRGSVTMYPDRRLSGALELGVADAMINSARNPRFESLFGPSQNGFRWLTLKISGSAAAPMDNFKELFESAEIRDQPNFNSGIPSFEDLTKPR